MRQNLLENRSDSTDDILKGRFIRQVLARESKEIDTAQQKYMTSRGFENENWYSGRAFSVTNDQMDLVHLKKHRFVDMKTIMTKTGTHRKRPHQIHNRILWGHYNNIIREMAFGFTQAVKEQMKTIGD